MIWGSNSSGRVQLDSGHEGEECTQGGEKQSARVWHGNEGKSTRMVQVQEPAFSLGPKAGFGAWTKDGHSQ